MPGSIREAVKRCTAGCASGQREPCERACTRCCGGLRRAAASRTAAPAAAAPCRSQRGDTAQHCTAHSDGTTLSGRGWRGAQVPAASAETSAAGGGSSTGAQSGTGVVLAVAMGGVVAMLLGCLCCGRRIYHACGTVRHGGARNAPRRNSTVPLVASAVLPGSGADAVGQHPPRARRLSSLELEEGAFEAALEAWTSPGASVRASARALLAQVRREVGEHVSEQARARPDCRPEPLKPGVLRAPGLRHGLAAARRAVLVVC